MNNEIQDKQFLALELTKILFNDKAEYRPEQVYKIYTYFLLQLTELIDETETVTSLKNEINKLQKENDELKANNRDILEPFCEALIKILDECKPNMEPYVYDALYNYIKIVKA